MLSDLKKGTPDIKETIDTYWTYHWSKDETAPAVTTNFIHDDLVRFLNSYRHNKLRYYKSYIYGLMRRFDIEILNVGVAKAEYIKGWKYTDKPTTLQAVIDFKMKEINNQ